MDRIFTVAVLVGSLRKNSFNLKLAKAMSSLAVTSQSFEFISIGDLPFYNPDLEDNDTPDSWRRFRENIQAADAILFVTPEYNRSLPAALKNALDVGSRPIGKSVWDRKPAAIITGSTGAVGGFGASQILRQSLVSLNVPTMLQPEAYIGGIAGLFDDTGNIVNADTRNFLGKFMAAFSAWIGAHIPKS